MPSTPSAVDTGAASGSRLRIARASATACVCQPEYDSTRSPTARRGDRDSSTSHTVAPSITSPMLTGSAYDSAVAHPAPHVGVEREVADAQQDLSVLERWEVDGDRLEVCGRRLAVGSGRQDDLGGLHGSLPNRTYPVSTGRSGSVIQPDQEPG